MKRLIVWLILLVIVAGGAYFGYRWYDQRGVSSTPSYRMGTVKRQDVAWTISATGTIVPEDVVDVGAQVNGLIVSFGTDVDGKPVDYRSTVRANAVLAKVDDALYAAQVATDEAALAQAQAAVTVSEANREQARAKVEQATRDWSRAQRLGESEALSQADYDASKSSFEQAKAGLTLVEAQIRQAHASVSSAEAALVRSRRNLFYCTILSPVDGVIIDRRVDIGQTVVSSLNAPSLFLIAKDLKKMQVLVQVNEADIGHVKPGEAVRFTSDAFPGEHFVGQVRKVRLNATQTQNVVTYTVEIVTDNAELKLLPYLTANVTFTLDRKDQVLTVPNAALRWAPSGASAGRSRSPAASGPAAGGAPSGNRSREKSADVGPRVWVLQGGVPTSIRVKAGISDGEVTEITTDELGDGDEIILGEMAASTAAASSTNPFAPQMFRGGGQRPGGGGR